MPRWVHVADAASVALFVLAAAVIVGGGFRLRFGDVRIAATSPLAPLLLLFVVVTARHYVVSRPSLAARARTAFDRLRRSDAWPACWGPFLLTRAAVVLIGFLALTTIGYAPGEPNTRLFDDEVMNLPVRWDAGWYYHVASVGYSWDALDDGQQNIAFFPAFPISTRVAARLFGGAPEAFILAGLALSHLAFFCALWLLYGLARDLTGDRSIARATVLLTACYPFALFYGAFYTESFFLLAAVGAMRAAHTGRAPAIAAAFGLLAGLTRPNGFLLTIPLLVLAARRAGAMSTPRRSAVAWVTAAWAPVAGVAIYSAFIGWLTRDPLAWYEQHQAWGRTFVGIAPVATAIDHLVRHGLASLVASQPYPLINLAGALIALALVVPIWRRIGAAYGLFVAVNVVPPLVLGGALSMGRVSATMFPMFIWLAIALPRQSGAMAAAFAMFQGFAAALFYTWRPLF